MSESPGATAPNGNGSGSEGGGGGEGELNRGLECIDNLEFYDPVDSRNTSITSTSSDGMQLAELSVLMEGFDVDETEGSTFHDAVEDPERWYGNPLTPERAMDLFPPTSLKNGLQWKAEVVPEIWWNEATGKVRATLQPRDFDLATAANKRIKPHRKTLPLTQRDLLSSLAETPDGRHIFHGKLNGWPQLTVLELVSLERKRPLLLNKAQYTPHWSSSSPVSSSTPATARTATAAPPRFDENDTNIYRATFRAPDWTSIGWSEASPGYCFWFEAVLAPAPRFSFGTNMLHTVSNRAGDRVARVHMISHRYAVRIESPRDKITYHSVVLLEWEHANYCTVVEGAYLNGIGGYKCQSNWYEDKMKAEHNLMSQWMPEELVGPWISTATEMRCLDVPQKNLEEFKEYLQRHRGNNGRFIDPQVTFSHPARLTFRSKRDVAQYLLNYVGRDCSYQELKTNCQTLAADLCAFLAGKRRVDPFHPIVKMEYRNRTHQFLYDSSMYHRTKKLQKHK